MRVVTGIYGASSVRLKIRGRTGYLIRSRSTYACILTEHCMCEYGSTLLYYDKNTIDIGKCKAEYESKKNIQNGRLSKVKISILLVF